jgi:hypothetical protein
MTDQSYEIRLMWAGPTSVRARIFCGGRDVTKKTPGSWFHWALDGVPFRRGTKTITVDLRAGDGPPHRVTCDLLKPDQPEGKNQ